MFKSKEQQFDFYWKEIFDGLAYNPIEFNTYRFDQTMSLPGKVNKLYDMFKILAMNNQEVMDYLKEFVETFDVKMYETIEDVLTVWLEDGRLADVVRAAINDEVIEARTDYLGKNYADLKERLDDERKEVIDSRGGAQSLAERLAEDKADVKTRVRIPSLSVNPESFSGTDFEKIQQAINEAIAEKKGIEITNNYDIGNNTLDIGHGGHRNNLVFFGGGKIIKSTKGYMFDSSVKLTGNIVFSNIRFSGEKGQECDLFNCNLIDRMPRLIRLNFENCSFLNIATAFKTTDYLQTIKLNNCDSEGITSSFFDVGGMINVSISGILADNYTGNFIKHHGVGAYPDLHNLTILNGCCFNTFNSAKVLDLGTSRSILIDGNYFEGGSGFITFKNGSINELVNVSNNVLSGTDTANALITWGSDVRNCTSENNMSFNKPVHDLRQIKTGRVLSVNDSNRTPNRQLSNYVIEEIGNEKSHILMDKIKDFSGSPGGNILLAGTENHAFLGFVTPEEMGKINDDNFVGSNLAAAIGLTKGNPINGFSQLLKFYYKGKILFIPMLPYRSSVSWDDLYDLGAVYGTDDEGALPKGGRCGQNLRIDASDNSINGTNMYFLGDKTSVTNGADTVGAVGDTLVLKGWSVNNGEVKIVSITNNKIVVSGATLVSEQGSRNARVYNKSKAVVQDKKVTIGRHRYKVRLIRTASNIYSSDFATSDKGILGVYNEWNDLILPLSEKAKYNALSWKYPEFARDEYNQNLYGWGSSIADHQFLQGIANGGKMIFGQNNVSHAPWKKVYRGYHALEYADIVDSHTGFLEQAWIPVLELI